MHTRNPGQGFRWIGTALLALALVAAVYAIWGRNRDILRDLYDYSTVIAAAGKVDAGFKPYTDVRSPMQTSVYYLNWLTESVFGKSYLALTWGGLLQALGGGLLVVCLLRRTMGLAGALVVAAAIMFAGLIQHAVFFYNPVGILCFGLVVMGLAIEPRLWTWRIETVIVWAALIVGGTNKLNFQALAIGIGGILMLRGWAAGNIRAREAGLSIFGLLFAGVVLPLAIELAWTGASLTTWIEEVVVRPALRRHMATVWPDLRIFLQPAHDYHHHLLFRPMGGLGLAVLAAIVGRVIWSGRKQGAPWPDLLLRVTLGVVGGVGSVLLMVTNVETVMLTSLGFFLAAFCLYLACRKPHAGFDGALGGLLAVSLIWSVGGGYAAWHGSRVLYAQDPPPRSTYVRLENAPHALAYFEGVRFPLQKLQSMRELSEQMERMLRENGSMDGVLFGPAVEWLERAYPHAIVPGMPIWFHNGTSLHDSDAEWFAGILRAEGTRQIVADVNWEIWPRSFRETMFDRFKAERRGGRYRIYTTLPAPDVFTQQ
jgi:hypothetical protein